MKATEDSKFCQKCGYKLSHISIEKKEFVNYLMEKRRDSQNEYEAQVFDQIIPKVQNNEFRKIRIVNSTFKGTDIFGFLIDNEGNLKLECPQETAAQILFITIVNGIDAIQNSILRISTGIHDDRIAYIKAAQYQYTRAKASKNKKRADTLIEIADQENVLGLCMIKKELQRNLDLLGQIPKNLAKKIVSGTKLADAKETIAQLQESFPSYFEALKLLLEIDSQYGETGCMRVALNNEKKFVNQIMESEGFRRFLELDEENAEVWNNALINCKTYLYFADESIHGNEIQLTIVEDING